jgi:pyruvate,water dikinase
MPTNQAAPSLKEKDNMLIIRDDSTEPVNLGGKANSLLKLSRNKINVPHFFVISSELFAQFLRDNGLIKVIKHGSKGEIQAAITKASFPDDLAQQIYQSFDDYDFRLVSCRSSAANEDGTEKSFAGQYESYLNVSRENLLDVVKKCWLSLYEDNVSAYSGEKAGYGMNVVVQAMVEAEFAGVAFSLDPTSHSKNYSVTEVVRGLGESLVSGMVTPSRFIIRRETEHADLKIGDIELPDEMIARLEKTFLQIESIYETPVDIEWAIVNDEIFILQTRPITAFNTAKVPFEKVISRERSVAELQLYQRGEYDGIKKLTRGMYYFKSLAVYRPAKTLVDLYYNHADVEELPTPMYYYMDQDFTETEGKLHNAQKAAAALNDLIDSRQEIDLDRFSKWITSIQPFSSLGELVGVGQFYATDRLKKLLIDFRKNYGDILYKANEYLNTTISAKLPDSYTKFANFVTLDEVFGHSLPNLAELKKRTLGYVLLDGKLTNYDNLGQVLDAMNITLENENSSNDEAKTLRGAMAYGSHLTGKIKKIFSTEEFGKFSDGDILATTMTTPKFTPILGKARAIITDEGGDDFTCGNYCARNENPHSCRHKACDRDPE